MRNNKKLLTEALAHAIFDFIFKTFGFNKKIAKQVLSDPLIQAQVKKMQKSMLEMENIIREREELQRERGQI